MKRTTAAIPLILLALAVSAQDSDSPEREELRRFNAAVAAACGVERWSVKTATDNDADLVDASSFVPTTIPTMTSWTKPASLPGNNRILPYEATVYQLNVTLDAYVLEADSDIHLVLDDNLGSTMIAEIPNPACVGSTSPFYDAIISARQQFLARYTPTTNFKVANVPVLISGIGFFDFLHSQTGVAPNGIELHTVLDIQFQPGIAAEFSLAGSPSMLTLNQGGVETVTLVTQAMGGFNSAISYGITGLPAGVTAASSPSATPVPGSGLMRLTLTADCLATPGTFPLVITATGGAISHTFNAALTIPATPVVPDVGNALTVEKVPECLGAAHPVISQFQTGGAGGGTDEFIELFNPLPSDFNLTGYSLKYHTFSNNPGGAGGPFPAGTIIPAFSYLLAAPTSYTGAVGPDVTISSGMSSTAGHLYLVQGTATMTSTCLPSGNVIIDRVGYGPTANCPEGTVVAPAPGTSNSTKRRPNNSSGSGTDTDNNGADFLAATPSTPRNSSSRAVCEGITLRWPAAAVDSYHVYRDISGDMLGAALIGDLSQGVTSLDDPEPGSFFYQAFNYTLCAGESGD